jgi:hypothetical protein
MTYFSTGQTKLTACLVAVALAVQPAFAVPCPCNVSPPPAAGERPAAAAPHRCCCTGEAVCRCGQSCCRRQAPAGTSRTPLCTCSANRPAPQFPPAGKSGPALDLALVPPSLAAVAVEIPREARGSDIPVAFASAADRCIALGKLRF